MESQTALSPPPRKNSTPTKIAKQNLTPLQVLLQMGFPKNRAEKALTATGYRGVQLASDWLLAHVYDPMLDDNMPREFILYLCPTGQLLEELEVFFHKSSLKCGRNGAHNYMAHMTLCPGFKVPDHNVCNLIQILSDVITKMKGVLPHKIELEPYVSPNFIGLFASDKAVEALQKFSLEFLKEVSSKILHSDSQTFDALATCFPWCAGSGSSFMGETWLQSEAQPCKSFHITLAYQFNSQQYTYLQELVNEVDLFSLCNWEIRLYSRDSRLSNNEVYRVIYPHIPREMDELELVIGDFIYINPGSLTASLDGWVEGISWLTGCAGYLPGNYVERVPESDAWTLHKSFTLSKDLDLSSLDDISLSRRSRVGINLSCPSVSDETNNEVRSSGGADDPPQDFDALYAKVNKSSKKKSLESSDKGLRSVYIARHGERIDFAFGSWVPYCFNSEGTYSRKDLNMPVNVPMRKAGPQAYVKDSPLTVLGSLQARLTGEAMKNSGVVIHHALSSSSYRCVQTCDYILEGLGIRDTLPIRVEPGLFEWLGWYKEGLPDWFTTEELKAIGFNIDLGYKPYVRRLELEDKTESSQQYYLRSFYVMQNVIKNFEGNVLLVGHAATLDTCSRQLLGNAPRTAQELQKLVQKVPYCSVAVVKENLVSTADKNLGEWSLIEPPFPPMTTSANMRYDWRVLNT